MREKSDEDYKNENINEDEEENIIYLLHIFKLIIFYKL